MSRRTASQGRNARSVRAWIGAALAVGFATASSSQVGVAAEPPEPQREIALRRIADEAREAHQRGDYLRAAQLYWQGWLLDPSDGGFLYGSARSLQLGGDLLGAIGRYQAFLKLRHQRAELVARARRSLAEAEAALRDRGRSPPAAVPASAATPTDLSEPATPSPAAPAATPAPVTPVKRHALGTTSRHN